jgi:thioredoxin-like negative regulator of GroEL
MIWLSLVEDNPALAQRYNVAQLPALFFVQNGRVAAEAAGATMETQLRGWIDAALRGGSLPALHGATVPLHEHPRPQPASAPHPASAPQAKNGTVQPVVLIDATFD